uniref:Uncharacterized protein n=1 Tax=Magallana gigas TaxID=29159 RepID=K1QTH5_MAGGI
MNRYKGFKEIQSWVFDNKLQNVNMFTTSYTEQVLAYLDLSQPSALQELQSSIECLRCAGVLICPDKLCSFPGKVPIGKTCNLEDSSQVSHPFTVAGKTLCITVPQGVRTKWPGPLESSLSFRKGLTKRDLAMADRLNVHHVAVETTDL